MKTIRIISTLVTIVLFCQASYAQPKEKGKPNKDKVKAMKVAYITEKLNLSSEEAQKFWPIYNEFDDEMEAIHKQIRQMHKKDDAIDDMTDAEVEKMINSHTELRQNEFDVEKKYHEKFKQVLSIKKIAKLYKADHDFKRDLLQKLKDHNGPPHPPRH